MDRIPEAYSRNALQNHPQLSVIIINWNSVDLLPQCLDSIERGASGIRCEVIVVDNGSFDGCSQLITETYPSVTFVQLEQNVGFASANNLASKLARAEALLFLNPDTIVHDNAIAEMYKVLHSFPSAGAVGAQLVNPDGSIQRSCVQAFPTVINSLLSGNLLRLLFPRSRLWGDSVLECRNAGPFSVDTVSGACLMIRKALFGALGGFSTDYFMYAEDRDLCYQATKRGYRNVYCSGARVTHLGGQSAVRQQWGFAAVFGCEARWQFLARHRSRTAAGAFRVGMGLSAVMRLLLLSIFGIPMKVFGMCSSPVNSIRKWSAILKWSVYRERCVSRLRAASVGG